MSAPLLESTRQPAEALQLPTVGDDVNGRYHVRGELGRGGMAVVLAADDNVLERPVALKVILPVLSASREAVERFVNEARSLAKLDSPHVVRVLDGGRLVSPVACAGLPFMVLELLRGEDLYSVAAREGGLSAERVVRYAREACAGLAAAHAQGIIHRDLKPENLFLAHDGQGNECLKVLDFGIARSHSRRALTRNRTGLGSPGYMSPEQVQGADEVDGRADIWALGVVMYELLADRAAFSGDDPRSLCAQTLSAAVVPLRELRPDLPLALTEVVERCLEREPARRFGSVVQLSEALANVQLAENLSPRTESAALSENSPEELADSEFSELGAPVGAPRPRPARRAISLLVAALILAPCVVLLPRVARAPELAPARAWSARVVERAESAWRRARLRAHELWMKEPAGPSAPGEP